MKKEKKKKKITLNLKTKVFKKSKLSKKYTMKILFG